MKDSINSLVPNKDAQLALLWELYKCGGEGDTGYIVDRAMACFPVLQTPTQLDREVPIGRPWWPGRFRFDLSSLGKAGEARNIRRGSWRITQKGKERLIEAGYRVEKELATDYMQKEGQTVSELTVTEKLFHVWEEHSEGTKAEKCQQLSERIFGLLTLMALPETKPLFNKLWELLDFNELYRLTGKLGATGIWGGIDEGELF